MISRVCYCFRLSRVSYSLYCKKLSVHNSNFAFLFNCTQVAWASDSMIVLA